MQIRFNHKNKKIGFSMAEALISFMLIGLALAATLPLMTQMSQLKIGTDKNTSKCISANTSTGWYDETNGDTSVPNKETYPECYAAVLDAIHKRGSIVETATWFADKGTDGTNGTTDQKTLAKKILRTACDQGSEKACDYFLNACAKNGSSEAPYCDNSNSFLDLTYYLHQGTDSTNAGVKYIQEQLDTLLPKMITNLLKEAEYAVSNNQLPTGGSYSPQQNLNNNIASSAYNLPKILITGCNRGSTTACENAFDSFGYNTSCGGIKSAWADAPSGTYKIYAINYTTYDPNTNYEPVSIYCDMTSDNSASISGCSAADTYSWVDCANAYYANLNRSCSQIFDAIGPIDGNYRLTPSEVTPDEELTACSTGYTCTNKGKGTTCTDGTIYVGTINDIAIFAAPDDYNTSVSWATRLTKEIAGAQSEDDGTTNTTNLDAIAAYDPNSDIGPSNDYFGQYDAAHLCSNLNSLGFTDWYLPAKNELNVIMSNSETIGNFSGSLSEYYASSTESSSTGAYVGYRTQTGSFYTVKNALMHVRCVRKTTTPNATCSSVGNTCDNGSVYAGQSGAKYLYVPPGDQGHATWNNGNSGFSSTNVLDINDGLANTTKLTTEPTITQIDAPYPAADVCNALNTSKYLGYTNWYLPSRTEMNMLCSSKSTGDLNGTFLGTYYWTSTEVSETNAYRIEMSSCNYSSSSKDDNYNVRCIRKAY